jgi:anti-sigma-K factor RskA
MSEEEVKELVGLYALGALDEATAQRLESRLRSASEETRHEAEDLREVAALLALAPPTADVQPQVKDKLLARLSEEAAPAANGHRANVVVFPPRPRRESRPTRWLLIAATVAFAALSGVLYWQNRQLSAQRDELAREVETYSNEVRTQRQQIAAQRQELNAITAPSSQIISLSGESHAPQASAKLVWDKTTNRWVIYFYNLPAAPPDKAYQLWYVTKDKGPIPAPVFTADAQGRAEVRVSVPPDIAPRVALAAVTLEPKTGSQQPSSPIFLKGAV